LCGGLLAGIRRVVWHTRRGMIVGGLFAMGFPQAVTAICLSFPLLMSLCGPLPFLSPSLSLLYCWCLLLIHLRLPFRPYRSSPSQQKEGVGGRSSLPSRHSRPGQPSPLFYLPLILPTAPSYWTYYAVLASILSGILPLGVVLCLRGAQLLITRGGYPEEDNW